MKKFINLVGKKFGGLKVIGLAGKSSRGYSWWCICSCGNKIKVTTSYLQKYTPLNCGCGVLPNPKDFYLWNIKNIIGKVFGRLKVVSLSNIGPRGVSWICKCSCGCVVSIKEGKLLSKHASCGCNQGGEWTEKRKQNHSVLMKDIMQSSEIRSKIKNTSIGRLISQETRDKIGLANRGKSHPHSEETKKYLSEIKKLSPEKKMESLIKRFESKFVKGKLNECWEWLGSRVGGYGQIIGGVSGWPNRANRISYLLYVGPIPKGLCVCHKCDNPSCVNPNHLFLGTQADNLHDMDSKGRRVTANRPGESNPNAKLTEIKVIKIRKLWSTDKYKIIDLARMFNVGWTTIKKIISRESWCNVN